jgi:hypothetical protein
VRDDDVQRARHRPGERDDTRTGRAHRGTRQCREIDSEMAGAETRTRRVERAHNVARYRADPLGDRRRRGGLGRAQRGQQDDRDDRKQNTISQRGSLERDEHDSGKARGTAVKLPRAYDTVDGG